MSVLDGVCPIRWGVAKAASIDAHEFWKDQDYVGGAPLPEGSEDMVELYMTVHQIVLLQLAGKPLEIM